MTKKGSNFKRFLSKILVLMLVLTVAPTIQVNASDTSVDLIGDSVATSVGTVKDGVGYRQTGYLCYLLTADGNAVAGTQAYAFKCPSFHTIVNGGTPIFHASSRKGGYLATEWKGVAPWGCSPFNSDRTTNAEVIKTWLKARGTLGYSNGQHFIFLLWGTECMQKWETGEYILVIETIMHFRYSFDYTYADMTLREWENLIHGRSPSMPSSTVTVVAETYKRFADEGIEYRAPFGKPIIGTVRDCLAYQSTIYNLAQSANPFIEIDNTNLFSRYLNQVAPFSERIGAGSAGERAGFRAWTGSLESRLTNAQVNNYGVSMLVISALEDDLAGYVPEADVSSSGYDGTLYTLTSAGGSHSSVYASAEERFICNGTTTHIGSGYGADNAIIGSMYAENCATGDEPYALAQSHKRGMSYEGEIPPVVYSGTSFDVIADNSMGILPSMLTVDPATFPHVTISSSPESSYISYLDSIRGSLLPSVSIEYNGHTAGSFTGDSLETSAVIGGVADSKSYSVKRVCTLTQDNCKASDPDIDWGVSGDFDMLCLKFGQTFYNASTCAASSGSTVLENTDLLRAFWVSSDTYVAGLKADGTLQAYWEARLEEKRVSEGRSLGNSARSVWELENPAPVEPSEEGYTEEDDYEEALEEYEDALAEWQEHSDSEYERAYTEGYNSVDASTFTCPYETSNSWVFKYYYCSPIMQRLYGVHDKLPIDDGPSRGSKLWDDAWQVSFSLSVQNTAPLGSDVLDRMIVYMPLAGSICTDVGSVTNVGYYALDNHIPYTDFLLPDATSMDMR
ncbi:MAG: hypothetical protein J6B90_08695 [Lachnospiraceae bacterium]|nr:hypothetical protein [Lachnospiraceae bacterium]